MSRLRRERLRVMTLNVNLHPIASQLDERAAAIAALLRTHRPDVLCVQEASTSRPELLAGIAAASSMPLVAYAQHFHADGREPSAVAVLSALEAGPSHVLTLPTQYGLTRQVAAVSLTAPSGRPVLALSAHLCWGGNLEPARQREAQLIDDWCQRLAPAETLVVAGGDLNATPSSSTLRYLTGLDGLNGRGTYWVDGWAAAGHGPGTTSTPANPGAVETAIRGQIGRPQDLPDRRIDYVLVRGWVHGRAGSPLSAQVVGAEPAGPDAVVASDHYGVLVELWDPPVSPSSAGAR